MNTNVNILCYKSKTLSNGEHPLMIRVCKDAKKKYLSLGISVNPDHWDFKKNKPKSNCPNKEYINKIIADKSNEFSEQIVKLKSEHKEFTATSLLDEGLKKVKPKTVNDVFLEQLQRLTDGLVTEAGLEAHIPITKWLRINNELKASNIGCGINEPVFNAGYSLLPTFRLEWHFELFGDVSINYMESKNLEAGNILQTCHSIWKGDNVTKLQQIYIGYQVGVQFIFYILCFLSRFTQRCLFRTTNSERNELTLHLNR